MSKIDLGDDEENEAIVDEVKFNETQKKCFDDELDKNDTGLLKLEDEIEGQKIEDEEEGQKIEDEEEGQKIESLKTYKGYFYYNMNFALQGMTQTIMFACNQLVASLIFDIYNVSALGSVMTLDN